MAQFQGHFRGHKVMFDLEFAKSKIFLNANYEKYVGDWVCKVELLILLILVYSRFLF